MEVQKAYEKREIKPFFQPIYDAVSGKAVCAEVLSRWIKEDGTFVMPGDYIPVLEQSDAIWELDWYMLKESCIAMKEQREKGIPCVKVSVNFSRKHIEDTEFAEKLCKLVDEYEIKHKLIQIEITESALVNNNVQQLDAFVTAIRNKGFAVAIDDFGCGLSSLSTVKDVAIDTLKIDRSLLSHNCEDEKERIVLESILDFAHRLKLTTVAEGVETTEQLGFLRTCGCKLIQGYLFAKPMPKEAFWEVCRADAQEAFSEDILSVQSQASAVQLLLEAVYMRYPLIIYINLTRNSYYMMKYENFTTKSCVAAGAFDECIAHASGTMHPEDQEAFRQTFCIENQMAAYERGEKYISLLVRQLGDDNVYRRVEVTNYFVTNQSSDDVLVISLSHNLD
ncbi:MAG: EAL domain-containing protein [Lachnospiraceae bacterium]|nr:EAL domain-containing protein [Lachnospiraceae bacterium]